MKLLRFVLVYLALCAPVWAQGGMMPGPGTPHGTATPTWTGTGTGVNNACGFGSTCATSAGVAVTSGFNVASVYADMGGSTTNDITGVSLGAPCSTSFTRTVTDGAITDTHIVDLWQGTVGTGGTCTVTITTTSNTLDRVLVAIGVFANLTSTTATGTCSAAFTGANSPYPCGSAVTVPASGFAIVGAGFNNSGSIGVSGATFTIDQQVNGTVPSLVIGHNGTAGSVTPSATAVSTVHGGIVAATFH